MRRFPAVLQALSLVLILVGPVFAQEPQMPPGMPQPQAPKQQCDPRLCDKTIAALNGLVGLREAEKDSTLEDARRLITEANDQLRRTASDWAATFQAWCGDRPACGLAPAATHEDPSAGP